ncbi:MAG: alpha-N-acetylglucosaminidase [Bacteroidales bacterium]|nr:alpha-N-acetylglucosaminidase [Bacteroidales bacterium]
MRKTALLIVVMLCTCAGASGQKAARALAERILGSNAQQFEFYTYRQLAAEEGRPQHDGFSLFQKGNKICIVGNNDNAMCMGLNYYLKEYAHTTVGWYASDPIELPKRLPRVAARVDRMADVETRFFLNYCTYGYTMVWWQWPQWERFIDWMALNGINMPLSLTGQEAVWQEVWREMGMTDEEIRSYFSGPAHLPWHRMANLDSFGGPLPQAWIDGQRELQKKIVARERELNMTPVLPAFAGHVPQRIAQLYPQADIKRLSSWCGFEPTCFMNATDSLFAVIQQKYLQKQTALYGTDHIYGLDPFNEMDPPSWEPDYLAGVSKNIFASLQQVDAEARWLQMSWVFYYKRGQWTPERLKAYLTAVPQGKMMLLDYFCEKTEVWRLSEAFYGQPFIWCYLGNFGGNTMLVGDIPAIGSKYDQAIKDQPGNMMGVGSTLEGFDNSPQIFEYLFGHAWQGRDTAEHTRRFAQQWADQRYGTASPYAREAWQMLIDSVYKDWSFYGLGSQMVARPTLSGHGTYYTKPYYSYDNATLLRAIRLLMKEPSSRRGFQYDVANLMSQWMGNHFMEVRDAFTDAYRRRDTNAMKRYSQMALKLIDQADELLQDYPSANLDDWMIEAREWGQSDAEKDYYEQQARTLLTIWGGPVLNDYANRAWSGLLSGYYANRWRLFFDAVMEAVKGGNAFDEKAFNSLLSVYENEWPGTKPAMRKRGKGNTIMCVLSILKQIDAEQYSVPNRAAKVLGDYMKQFPEAQLQDVYKACFQDVYGPGHIIQDSASCAQYILDELRQMNPESHTYPYYEYIGVENNFVRVNIRVIEEGKVELGRFVQLLMQSAKLPSKLPLYDWRGQWERIEKVVRQVSPQPKNFDEDAALLRSMMDQGQYVVHHSAHFNQTYNPHYRIIRRDLFEKEILPLLYDGRLSDFGNR